MTHLMGANRFVRAGVARSAMPKHRASAATPPGSRFGPPQAAIFCPPASLRAACGGLAPRRTPRLAIGQNTSGEIGHNQRALVL